MWVKTFSLETCELFSLFLVFCNFMIYLEFLSIAFSAPIEIVAWFLLFLLWMWSITLIDLLCWIILVTLGWIPLGYSVWCFSCVVGFGLLIFCWELSHLYSSKILACKFLFWWCLYLVSVSGWWGLHRLSLGVFSPSSVFWKSFSRIGLSSSLYAW